MSVIKFKAIIHTIYKSGMEETYVCRGDCTPDEITQISEYLLAQIWEEEGHILKEAKIISIEII